MNTATTLKNSTAIALGGFDGMHKAHQKLFSELGEHGAVVVVENGYSSLTPKTYRNTHTSYPVLHLLLENIRHMDAKLFVELLKKEFPKLQKIVVGYDFYFGKDRKYSAKCLQEYCCCEVVVVDEVMVDGLSVHSRYIREFIHSGKLPQANNLLGYNYTIEGKKVTGQGLGERELFPTVNLQVEEFSLPKEGVYASKTQLDGKGEFYDSITFLGHRKTTDGTFAIETHILDKVITCKQSAKIEFLELIRENKKFATLHQLKDAIVKDIEARKKIV